MPPLISVIIPAFNEEKKIETTVRQFSELNISHEVIVSDSASTDKTMDIARTCADKVIMLPPEKKPGVSPARNDGVAVAAGAYYVFIDSDTFIPNPNEFFKKALARFEKDPHLAGLSARIEVRRDEATPSDRAVSFLMNIWFFILNKVFHVGIASGKFIMVKATSFKRTGGFDERLKTAEDVDLFNKLAKFGNTRIAWDLVVYHEGRRFHHLGAWHTLYKWIHNGVSFWIFKRSSDTWEPVR
jgi:glycosyltransferase involved in cell wall biosynthesis